MTANRAARALGISEVTMGLWIRAAKPTGRLRPVVVTTDAQEQPSRARTPSRASSMLTLRTAQGHELGPPDVQTAVALVRSLS
jgi:hypothetical protein